MTVNFIKAGQKTYVEKVPVGVRSLELKPAIYTVECSREEGFYLVEIGDKYSLPEKMYGNHKAAAERVIQTHYNTPGNTGVLLTGLKGTGKSLFIKVISNIVLDKNMPVIQINKPFAGEDIFNFIENIGNCALVFDEFGKNYSIYNNNSTPTQVSLLSLLDGLTNSKRLHLFTENKLEDISEYLLNRPGRVHYHFRYDRLPTNVIRELCKDNKVTEEITEELVNLSSRLKVLSFDIVKCLIGEWKAYGGTIQDHLDILNVTLLRNPSNKVIELLSFTTSDGVEIPVNTLSISKNHDRIYIEPANHSNTPREAQVNLMCYMEDVSMIENNIYHFTTERGTKFSVMIND